MAIVTKPYGDFVNNVDVADANRVNAQFNTLYNLVNGGLDGSNVPGLGDMTTVTTTAKTAAGAINELQALPVFAMSRQAIINGNFDVWQRGTSFTNPSSGQYTADRYVASYSSTGTLPTTITHSRQQLTPGDIPNSFWYYRINTNGAGSGFGANDNYTLIQKIENGTRNLCGSGKKITITFYARSDIAGKRLGVNAAQVYGTGGSPSSTDTLVGQIITLTSTWTKYTVTLTTSTLVGKTFGTNYDDTINVNFSVMFGSSIASTRFGTSTTETFGGAGNIDIAQLQVNAGDQPLPFQPRSFAEELALCQRYYWQSYTTISTIGSVCNLAYSTSGLAGGVRFSVRMRVPPTLTISNNGVSNQVRRTTDNVTIAVSGFNPSYTDKGISYINFSGTPFTANTPYDYDINADAEL